ncbi:disintegrin and metalloproteinase domain-containing protein 28 [Chanos chanos]|uniref:Disintegrin and metalloproteinase domain-containing protein 28 n=1 Tax=Chanos chanos TaxID=29144 RepID=A0A6J2WTT2_CHACN|nr:zinc metalloproteinase-disintegrin-like batroxstatin-1 [Chanos chanos]
MASKPLLLWIFTLLLLLPPSGTHTLELDGVKIHAVVRPVRLHSQHKRDLEPSRPDVVKYAMKLDGKDIEMHLERNTGLLTKDYSETQYTENGARITTTPKDLDHCYYQGKISNDEESIVSMSTCDGLRGYFQTAEQRYLIEPLSEDGEGDHAVLKFDDANNETKTCGVTNTTWEGVDSLPPRTSKSRSRASQPTLLQQQKYIELYLVADTREFKKMDSDENKLRKRMFEIVNYVNAVYRPLNTFIALTGLAVWKQQDMISVTSSAGANLDKFTEWRNSELVKVKRHDNAHLISAIDFDGATVGLAYIGTLCGSHSTGVVQDHNPRAIAVGATLSHEMGHNLGMNHDSGGCVCPAASCIMAAALSYSVPREFSSCSTQSYEKFLDTRNPECILNKPDRNSLVSPPVCGNGFQEKGEECDCGTLQECTNPCCNATTCKLTDGSECAAGDCCQDCKLAPPTLECRAKHDECDLAEYCTGKSAQCPEDVFSVNGIPCQNGKGYCYNGQCPQLADQCVKMWGGTAEVADKSCFQQNKRGLYYAFCKRTKDQYIPCQSQDIMCGKLFCKNGNSNPNYGRMVMFNNCKATFYSDSDNDFGQVDSGTKCGDGKVCSQNECVDLETAYRATNCSAKCKGHGVCNHKLQCQCEPGWLPPNCDRKEDHPLPSGGVIAIAVIACLLVLAGLIIVGVLLWKRRKAAPSSTGHRMQKKGYAVNNARFNAPHQTPSNQSPSTTIRPKGPPPPPPASKTSRPLHQNFVEARKALRPPPPRV